MGVGQYAAGVLIALGTTLSSALGLAMQKKVHLRLEVARERARRTRGAAGVAQAKALRSYRQPLWVAGLALMILASIVSLAVFALVGQAVASSFASVTILWNLLLAYLYLGERITWVDGVVSVVLIAGSVVAVYFGSKGRSESFLGPDQVHGLFTRAVAIALAAVLILIMVVLILGDMAIKRRRARSGVGHHKGQVSPRLLKFSIVMRLLTAGLASGWTGTCSKGVVTQLSYAGKYSQVGAVAGFEGFWLLLAGLPVALYLQISSLNSALKDGDATFVVPQYQAQIVVWGVVFGYIFYAEGAGKSTGDIIAFIVGVVIIVIGLSLLMLKRQHRPGVRGAGDASELALMDLADAVEELLRAHQPRAVALRKTASAPADYASGQGRPVEDMITRVGPQDLALVKKLVQGAAAGAGAGSDGHDLSIAHGVITADGKQVQDSGQATSEVGDDVVREQPSGVDVSSGEISSEALQAASTGLVSVLGPTFPLALHRPYISGSTLSRHFKVVVERAADGMDDDGQEDEGQEVDSATAAHGQDPARQAEARTGGTAAPSVPPAAAAPAAEPAQPLPPPHRRLLSTHRPRPLTLMQTVSAEALTVEWGQELAVAAGQAAQVAVQPTAAPPAGSTAGPGPPAADGSTAPPEAQPPVPPVEAQPSFRHRRGTSVDATGASIPPGTTSTYLRESVAVPADIALRVQLPVPPAILTEPARDARYRRTMAAADVAVLHPAKPRPLRLRIPPEGVPQATGIGSGDETRALASKHAPGQSRLAKAWARFRTWMKTPPRQKGSGSALVANGDDTAQPSGGHIVPAFEDEAPPSAPRRAEYVPMLLVPPSVTVPVAVIRQMSVSPSLLAAVLRAGPTRKPEPAAERQVAVTQAVTMGLAGLSATGPGDTLGVAQPGVPLEQRREARDVPLDIEPVL